MAPQPREFIGFFAPPELAREIKALARSRERTISGELRYLVREHLENERGAQSAELDDSQSRVLRKPVGERV
jgi:hypothetical protein